MAWKKSGLSAQRKRFLRLQLAAQESSEFQLTFEGRTRRCGKLDCPKRARARARADLQQRLLGDRGGNIKEYGINAIEK